MAEGITRTYGTVNLDTIKRWFKLGEDDSYVWMVNLMKYKARARYEDGTDGGRSGMEADDEYAPVDVLKSLGAEVAFMGAVEQQLEGSPDWDRVAIVRYPNRLSFMTMEQREDFQEKHVHKEAGMDFTIVFGALPDGDGVEAPAGARYLLRVRRLAEGSPAPAEPAGLRRVAHLKVDGVAVGDERNFDDCLFDVVEDDAALAAVQGQPGVEEQIALVLGRQIDRLVETINHLPEA